MRAMIGPALLVGPFLGLLGMVAMIAFVAIGSGSTSGLGAMSFFGLLIALILGFVVASPLAFAFGSILLRLSAADRRWTWRRVWAAAGLAVGLAASLPFASLSGGAEAWGVLAASCTVLGLVGALLSRRMLNRSISGLDEIDTDIFA